MRRIPAPRFLLPMVALALAGVGFAVFSGWAGATPTVHCVPNDGIDVSCGDGHGTIQGAIDDANPGDSVLVGDGTYDENIDINEAITVESVNGAASTTIAPSEGTPVTISADDATFGTPGQGFTVEVGAGGTALEVSAFVGDNTVTIEDNTFVGDDASYGVYVSSGILGGHLIVRNNMFEMAVNSATYSFYDAIYFSNTYVDHPIYDYLSAQSANIELLDNTINDFTGSAVYFSGDIYKSQVTVDDSTLTGVSGGASYGVYLSGNEVGGDVRAQSTVTISETGIDNVCSGVYAYNVKTQSALNIIDATITFSCQAVYLSQVDGQSSVLIDPSTFTGAGEASYGIYIGNGIYNGSSFTLEDTEITGFTYAGIYDLNLDYGSTATIRNSTLTGAYASYGVYGDLYAGSSLTINPTTISGWTDSGVYISDVIYNSSVLIDGNTLTASEDGGTQCFYFGYLADYGSTTTVSNNTCTGFNYAALYDSGGTYYGSASNITGNTFIARGCETAPPYDCTPGEGGATYGLYLDEISELSTLRINPNTVVGFTNTAVYFGDDIEDGSQVIVDGNTFTGDVDGAGYCFYLYYGIDTGSTVSFTGNTCTNFDYAALYSDDAIEDGVNLVVEDNTFTAWTGFPPPAPAGSLQNGGADYCWYFYYDIEDGSTVSINDNTCTGFTDSAFYLDDYLDYGSYLYIDGNTMDAHPDGADNCFYFYYDIDDGSHASMTNNTCTGFTYAAYENDDGITYGSSILFDNNTFTAWTGGMGGFEASAPQNGGGADYCFYFYYVVEDGSQGTITNNTCTGFTYVGIYMEDDIEYGSTFLVDNNTFNAHPDGADYGVWHDGYYIEYGSSGTFTNNTFTNIGNTSDSYGAYFYDVYEGASLTFSDNTVTGHENGLETGFYLEDGPEYGSMLVVNDNTFTGLKDFTEETGYGIYVYEPYDGSTAEVCRNTVTGHADGFSNGFYFSSYGAYDGSTTTVCDNEVTGYTDHGAYFESTDYGSTLNVLNNVLTAHSGGANYGIYMDGVEYGSNATVNGNEISGIKDLSPGSGMYQYDVWYGSTLEICGNTITAHPDGASYGLEFGYPAGGGSTLTICSNTVSGFTDTDLYFASSMYDGGTVNIDNNDFLGTLYGIRFSSSVDEGSTINITDNNIRNFTQDGISFASDVWGSEILVQNNIIEGSEDLMKGGASPLPNGGGNVGVNFVWDSIIGGAVANILDNCFNNVYTAIDVGNVADTAQANAHGNDLAVPSVVEGLDATGSTNTVDATNNWWGAADGPSGAGPGSGSAVSGNADFDPWLTSDPTDCGGTGAATATPSPTATASETATATRTSTPTQTSTPAPGATHTPTATRTPTRTPTVTRTATPTPAEGVCTGTPQQRAICEYCKKFPTHPYCSQQPPAGTGDGTATPTPTPEQVGEPTATPTRAAPSGASGLDRLCQQFPGLPVCNR